MNALTKQDTGLGFMMPKSLQEAMQFADILANSDLVPKDYQRKPGNILVALQWGAEIGLQPLQALQNIACINGRPAIWGDAMLALVRQSGLLASIHEEQSDDLATCIIQRKGEQERTVTFSKEDAKKAGLSGKQGPWTNYPKRMMQMRARAYALRDIFPDVLKGMAVAEEEQDKEIDVTPSAKPAEHKGSSALKDRLKTKKAVVEHAPESIFDVAACIDAINNAQALDELKAIAKAIPADLGEPAKSNIKTTYEAKKAELSVVVAPQMLPPESIDAIEAEMLAAVDNEALDAISDSRLTPYTAQMTEADIDRLNAAYKKRMNELNA